MRVITISLTDFEVRQLMEDIEYLKTEELGVWLETLHNELRDIRRCFGLPFELTDEEKAMRKPYTLEDDLVVLELTQEGIDTTTIAGRIDRTRHSISYRQAWQRKARLTTAKQLEEHHTRRGT